MISTAKAAGTPSASRLRPRSSPSSARATPTGSRRPERAFCGRATQAVVYGAAKPCIGNRRNGDCIPAAIFGDVKQIEQAGGRFHKVAGRGKVHVPENGRAAGRGGGWQ